MNNTPGVFQAFELQITTDFKDALGGRSESQVLINALEAQRDRLLAELRDDLTQHHTQQPDGRLPEDMDRLFNTIGQLNEMIGIAFDANQHVFRQVWQRAVQADLLQPEEGGQSHGH